MPHDGLWQRLQELEPEQTARRAACEYDQQQGRYVLQFLNTDYVVDPAARRIFRRDAQQDAKFLQQLCILAYLVNATELQPSGRLVSPEKLEAGQFFFRGFHSPPTDKLTAAFGAEPDRLYRAATRFDGSRADYGDASVSLSVLPRVPVVFVVWAADEEFDARAAVLFDDTAGRQLPLDALLTAVQLAIKALTEEPKSS